MDVNFIDFNVTPFRADRFFEIWEPAAARSMAFGAKSWKISRSEDNPLLFRQETVWENRADFERYWFSEELQQKRTEAINYYGKPLLPSWHSQIAGG